MRKSLVDCAASGKVSESRRADMARRAFFRCAARLFAYASCSGVPVARTASVVHAAEGATAPLAWRARRNVTGYNRKAARRAHGRLAPGTQALGRRGDLYWCG